MGVSLDELLDDTTPLPPPESKKRKPFWRNPNPLGCFALLQTLAIVILGALLATELLSQDGAHVMVVQLEATPLPAGALIVQGSLNVSPTPTVPMDQIPAIFTGEPPVITASIVDQVREVARFDDAEYMAWTAAGRTLAIYGKRFFNWYDIYQEKPLSDRFQLDTGNVWPFVISPDRHYILTSGSNQQLIEWDISRRRSRLKIGGLSGNVSAVGYSHYGEFLVLGSSDGEISVWNRDKSLIQWEVMPEPGAYARIVSLDFSPDDQRLLAAQQQQNGVIVRDVQTGDVVITIPTSQSPSDAVFSPDGDYIAYTIGKKIFVWDIQSQQISYELTGHASGITEISYAPDGRILASSAGDGTIMLWDIHTGTALRILLDERLPPYVKDMAFSPDGRLIAATYSEAGMYPLVLWGVANE